MSQRAIKAEAELKTKQLQTSQMQVALRVANERRAQAEETLNQLLVDPVLAAPMALSTDEALKKENEGLIGLLKAKEL